MKTYDKKVLELGLQAFAIENSEPEYIMDKADGSLISTYTDRDGNVCLKSKGSLYSDHCVAAMEYLAEPVNFPLKSFVEEMENKGYTVNLEWVSPHPDFRIVVYYTKPRLIILNARHRVTGEYYDQVELTKRMNYASVNLFTHCEVLENLETQTGIEGYVVIDAKKNWYKVKTPWYLERHRAKDFVNRPVEFVKLVLKEESDDVFSLVRDQEELYNEMVALERTVVDTANTIVKIVSDYYEANKHLDRKDFAIKGKSELHGFEFPLAMQYYSKGDEPDWKGFFLNVVKKIDWGIGLEDTSK